MTLASTLVARPQPDARDTRLGGRGSAIELGTSPVHVAPERIFKATDRLRGTLVGFVITLVAAITRFWDLRSPTDKGTPVFDEKHYVPQAWQVLTGGNWIEDNPGYGLVVHPPVGKWMIAFGEWLFGYTPLGWRFSAAVVGTLMVLIIYRMTRRLTRSTMLGAVAGVLAICDGVLFVQSRMGMLDIFQIFFLLASLAALVVDRDEMRVRMDRAYRERRVDKTDFGPRLGFRWWRFGAAVLLGLGLATKWSGIYFVLFYLVLSLGLDVATRRAYHVRRPWMGTLVRDALPAFASLAVLPILIYFAAFVPWFTSETSVYRHAVGQQVGTGGSWSWVPDAWRSLWYYEAGILKFHETLTNSAGYHHPWESKPWTWPMSLRPMLYAVSNGPDMCDGQQCVRIQMLIGSPAMWWMSFPMLIWGTWRWVVRRDWRYAVVLTGYAAGFLPWFANLDRQMYFFYATAMAPFLIMGLALCLGDLVGASPHIAVTAGEPRPTERRTIGLVLAAAYIGLVVANFIWLWPILTAEPISPAMWRMEIWLPSWG